MASSSASRAPAIYHLDVGIFWDERESLSLLFINFIKVGSIEKLPKSWVLWIHRWQGVVTTLDEYIKRTYLRRTGKRRSQLLLRFIHPYVEVSRSTVSWWIKETLKLAGIDISIFKRHSTRAVSSSEASKTGFSVSDILARGCWFSSSTW